MIFTMLLIINLMSSQLMQLTRSMRARTGMAPNKYVSLTLYHILFSMNSSMTSNSKMATSMVLSFSPSTRAVVMIQLSGTGQRLMSNFLVPGSARCPTFWYRAAPGVQLSGTGQRPILKSACKI